MFELAASSAFFITVCTQLDVPSLSLFKFLEIMVLLSDTADESKSEKYFNNNNQLSNNTF